MLTGRNVIVAVLTIAGISLLASAVSLFRPPDNGGLGGDSYGVRSHGYRALIELLKALDVPTERLLVPPDAVAGRDATLVLWKPNASLVELEPIYLRRVSDWVRGGGRVVLAPDRRSALEQASATFGGMRRRPTSGEPPKSIFDELALEGVTTETIALTSSKPATTNDSDSEQETPAKRSDSGVFDEELEMLRKLARGGDALAPTKTVNVELSGSLQALSDVRSLTLPETDLNVVKEGSTPPDGRLTIRDAEGTEHTLVAAWRLGQGEVIVVGSPLVAENLLLGRDDNSVLMTRLLAAPGRTVVFDEFYHGLTIRGNPFWLLSRPGYLTVALFLTAATGIWIWRASQFLGPPLEQAPVSRRSIGEYIDAMARFLQRGRSSAPTMLRSVRNGVLHSIAAELGLPAGHEHVEEVAAALARRDPGRSRRLVEAIAQVDRVLESGAKLREAEVVQLFRGMSNCL
jgi:hypothetical protein